MDLFQYVMAREPLLVPQLPILSPSNDGQSVPSPPHSARSHRPPIYACALCPGRLQFTSRGSLKRHVSNLHRPKSEFRCPFPRCRGRTNRRDKMHDHLRRHGLGSLWSRASITQLEVPLPAPTACEICLRNPPFQSWDEWFECIESHCRLETSLPDHVPDGQDGNGSGQTGGSGFGNGSPFPGPAGGGFLNPGASGGGMDFMGNGGGYSQPWPGTGYNASMSENSCERNRIPSDTSSASSHQVSTSPISPSTASRRSRCSSDSSDGSFPIPDGLVDNKGPTQDSQDWMPQKCRRCGHVSTSCPECPPDLRLAEWCHSCKDNMPSSISSRLLDFIGNYDRYQDLACNGVSSRRDMQYEIGFDRNLSRPTVYVVEDRPRGRPKFISPKWKRRSIDFPKCPSTETQKLDQTVTMSKGPFPTSLGITLDQTTLICSVLQLEIVFRIIQWTSFCFLGKSSPCSRESPKGKFRPFLCFCSH